MLTGHLIVYRIASGAYYEAHQQLRVIAVRYIKQANYDAAADLLAGGAIELLRAGPQQGASASGGDLAIMLVVEVYNKAEWEITEGTDDAEGRARKSKWIVDCFLGCLVNKFANYISYRAPNRAPAGIPGRGTYTEEIYSGDDRVEWTIWPY